MCTSCPYWIGLSWFLHHSTCLSVILKAKHCHLSNIYCSTNPVIVGLKPFHLYLEEKHLMTSRKVNKNLYPISMNKAMSLGMSIGHLARKYHLFCLTITVSLRLVITLLYFEVICLRVISMTGSFSLFRLNPFCAFNIEFDIAWLILWLLHVPGLPFKKMCFLNLYSTKLYSIAK